MDMKTNIRMTVGAGLKNTMASVFGEKAGWLGEPQQNNHGGYFTGEQQSQTAFSPKTTRTAIPAFQQALGPRPLAILAAGVLLAGLASGNAAAQDGQQKVVVTKVEDGDEPNPKPDSDKKDII